MCPCSSSFCAQDILSSKDNCPRVPGISRDLLINSTTVVTYIIPENTCVGRWALFALAPIWKPQRVTLSSSVYRNKVPLHFNWCIDRWISAQKEVWRDAQQAKRSTVIHQFEALFETRVDYFWCVRTCVCVCLCVCVPLCACVCVHAFKMYINCISQYFSYAFFFWCGKGSA